MPAQTLLGVLHERKCYADDLSLLDVQSAARATTSNYYSMVTTKFSTTIVQ